MIDFAGGEGKVSFIWNFTIESCTNKKSSKNENQRKWKISTILAILFTFVSYYYHVVNWLLYNFALFLLHFLRKWKIKLHSWIASRARVQSRVEYETYIIFNIQFVLIFFFYFSPIFLYSQRRRICCCWASLPHARRYDVDVFFQSVKWDRVDNPATILTSNNTYIFLDTHFSFLSCSRRPSICSLAWRWRRNVKIDFLHAMRSFSCCLPFYGALETLKFFRVASIGNLDDVRSSVVGRDANTKTQICDLKMQIMQRVKESPISTIINISCRCRILLNYLLIKFFMSISSGNEKNFHEEKKNIRNCRWLSRAEEFDGRCFLLRYKNKFSLVLMIVARRRVFVYVPTS